MDVTRLHSAFVSTGNKESAESVFLKRDRKRLSRWRGRKKNMMTIKASGVAFLLFFLLMGGIGMASHLQPTVLHVIRPSLVGSRQKVAPLDRTVRDATTVQQVYGAALALPRASKYPLPCPADFGLVYHLTFLDGTSQLQRLDVYPLGCHWVYLSQTDVRQADPGFLALLAKAIGLPSLIPAGLLPAS
jgi:hypothetical protein